jgi:hypothetical protein
MLIRAAVFVMAIYGLSAATHERNWQMGKLDLVTIVKADRNGPRSFDTITIPLVIRAGSLVYRAEETALSTVHTAATDAETAVALERSADAASVAPWTRNLPLRIEFAVQGRTLYYLDSAGKEHKARIVR